MYLALPEGDGGKPEVLSKFTLSSFYVKEIEPAGRPFEELVRMKKCNDSLFEEIMNEELDQDEIQEEDTIEYEWEKEFKESQLKNNHDPFSTKQTNFYQILGIDDLFLNAKPEDVRRAYKKLALLFHPDKNQDNNSLEGVENISEEVSKLIEENKQSKTEAQMEEEKKQKEINIKWLKIKEAYETLLDPEKRKKYDSTIEFDDTIPDDKDFETKEFFKSFGPVFLKNSIWSKRKPVPKIGDMSTPLDKVKKFYSFWFRFETWRDYSVEGEYNLDEASCRYEKRQMVKENKKMKSSLLKEEKTRLINLVQLAYRHDPRIKEEEEKEKKKKEMIKQERLKQRQREKEDEKKKNIQAIKEYEEKMKLEQEKSIKEKEDLTKEYIAIGQFVDIALSKEDLFQINLNAKVNTLKEIINSISAKENLNEKKQIFIQMSRAYFAVKIEDEKEEEKDNSTWTKEEIILLQKAVKKYPAGIKNRWELIEEVVKSKKKDNIIQMAHYLLTNPNIKIEGEINLMKLLKKKTENKPNEKDKNKENKVKETIKEEVNQWSNEEQKLLEAALKNYPSSLPANERWTNIAKEIPGKTKKQCVERYKYLASLVKKQNL